MRHNLVGMQQNLAFYNAENIGMNSVTFAVDFFYNEIKQWDFDNPVYSDATSHFIHMIWKNAKKMGKCGKNWFGMAHQIVRYVTQPL